MDEKDGGPAFPTHGDYKPSPWSGSGGAVGIFSHPGMTLRDWLAGQALPAVIAAYVEAQGRCLGTDHIALNCASHAYRLADAMLAVRKRP